MQAVAFASDLKDKFYLRECLATNGETKFVDEEEQEENSAYKSQQLVNKGCPVNCLTAQKSLNGINTSLRPQAIRKGTKIDDDNTNARVRNRQAPIEA